MIWYILKRLIAAVPTLIAVLTVVFLIVRVIPGDPAMTVLGDQATPAALEALRAKLGTDRPLYVQYWEFLWAALQGDLGRSIWTGAPVSEEIVARIGVTIELVISSLAVSVALAVPAGCLMAYVRGGLADTVVRLLTIVGITIPSFWLGIVMLYALVQLAPGLQLVGWVPFGIDPLGNLQRMILPTVALALPILASLSRIVRTAMLDALGQDYIRTARAKGVSERAVVYKHALRNALIPFVTTVGIVAGYLFGGAIVVEQVFALPGLGRLIVGAITTAHPETSSDAR